MKFVLDACTWIHLYNGGIIHKLIQSEDIYFIPDIILELEIDTQGLNSYITNNFNIVSSDADYNQLIKEMREKYGYKSSEYDYYACHCAKLHACILLSSDYNIIYKVAKGENIECYDIIWLLDKLLTDNVINHDGYIAAINKILLKVNKGDLRLRLLNRRKELEAMKRRGV